jgi:hypothetical protein
VKQEPVAIDRAGSPSFRMAIELPMRSAKAILMVSAVEDITRTDLYVRPRST